MSHQDRREPLPVNYQYGDTSKKIQLVKSLLDSGIEAFLDQWGIEQPDGSEPTIDDFMLHVSRS